MKNSYVLSEQRIILPGQKAVTSPWPSKNISFKFRILNKVLEAFEWFTWLFFSFGNGYFMAWACLGVALQDWARVWAALGQTWVLKLDGFFQILAILRSPALTLKEVDSNIEEPIVDWF